MVSKIGIISLGCFKNLADSEAVMARLAAQGFEVRQGAEGVDALVINTCGFIDAAKQESVETILQMLELKKSRDLQLVAVVGCMVELYRDELSKEIPEVDLWLGIKDMDRLADVLTEKLNPGAADLKSAPRIITTLPHFSYLKIAEGCSHGCRFCSIPIIRGPYRSRSADDILNEAKFLEEQGIKELNLIAQDTTAYGRDLKPRADLTGLIEQILQTTGIPWVRILYAHPEHIDDSLIELMARQERLLSYLDIPLQHISDKVLKGMGRRMSGDKTAELIAKLRKRIPGLALRTTFLVGYPGETDTEFEELMAYIQQARFERLGAFEFSPQEITSAAGLPNQVPQEIAQERLIELMQLQQEISWEINQSLKGRVETVIVDESAEEAEFDYLGRLYSQAYEIDGAVMLQGDFEPGSFAKVEIIEGFEYDLLARQVS